ncbi:MAG: transcription termination factor Rho [Prevotella sp.]|nr:transcription termination factor Rho [Prevotella sp.]
MYTKDELMSKSYEALTDIANRMNIEVGRHATAEEISYAILDEQAFQEGNKNPLGARRQRIRAAKVNTSQVSDGKSKRKRAAGNSSSAGESLFADEHAKDIRGSETNNDAAGDTTHTNPDQAPAAEGEASGMPVWLSPEEELAAIPKHRGRRTKRELELIAMIKEKNKKAMETQTTEENPSPAPAETQAAESPEAEQEPANGTSAGAQPAPADDGVWAGDPADGTDFIAVVDVPIEDSEQIPTYDIFGHPYYNQPEQHIAPLNHAPQANFAAGAEYDFANLIDCNGVLEILGEGYGFLRSSDYNYLSSPDDVYVSQAFVKRYGLKTGDVVQGRVRPPKESEQYFTLTSAGMINGRKPEEIRDRIAFEHLTPLFPDEKFTLCGDRRTTNTSTRIVDLFSPIGKGQRALIVAQPKTGKTILMKDIANAIAANHPEAYLMMLLIDERPEEVTDMARTVNAEVIASTFDEPADRHVKIAGIVLEKAKRLVECGHDVVIFLDSITRLARAYNTVAPASGKVLTGGVDANALQKPKRFFGAARNIEGGGSLTIIATALIDTGSKMDEVIFEEFKGTGNMELQLDRTLSNKRIFPSVNLVASSTRRDDLLQDETTLNRMWILRKHISDMTAMEAMDTIRQSLERTRDNAEFLLSMNS